MTVKVVDNGDSLNTYENVTSCFVNESGYWRIDHAGGVAFLSIRIVAELHQIGDFYNAVDKH